MSPSATTITLIKPNRGLLDLGLSEILAHRELLLFMVGRELKIRYKQAAIGAGWAIIQPTLSALIFTVIFGYFAKIPSDGIPYPLFAFTAMLAWTYFAEALRRGSLCLVEDSELLRKIYFPRLIMPLAMVVTPLVDLLVACVVLGGLCAWYGVVPTWNVLYLPLFVLLTMILALSLALWLGPINVKFRDVKYTMPFLIQIWMYASPVAYPLSVVPERWKFLYSLNPMVGVLEGFRWSLFGANSPDFEVMGASAGFILVILVTGIIFFKKSERAFADIV